ncbi:hypothetical protein EC973_008551 [Apophysomyces ossiformis]|uniref:Uncharacterized protein n=1 Tax=Apophysomyces ossiformis TaxID=679940 RepID=A0A8H7BTB4_9FUNG|nr:hypothetical protein EC973_008551 [Apophysomyces ossiformis]
MPQMPNKNVFEPKDPRIINLYEEDEDELDEWSFTSSSDLTSKPRRRKTGTQALVEFLNNTSPEEFQKTTTKRPSTLFSRLLKNKPPPPTAASTRSQPSSSTSCPTPTTRTYLQKPGADAPNTIHRRNYIEIVANPYHDSSPAASYGQHRLSYASTGRNSALRRSVISNSDQQGPVLPSNRSKKRESSLYSGSLRYSMSVKSHVSNNPSSLRGRPLMLMRQDIEAASARSSTIGRAGGGREWESQQEMGDIQHRKRPDGEEEEVVDKTLDENNVVAHLGEHVDTIEAGLLQRLERFRLVKADKPSDTMANALAKEHERALLSPNQEPSEKKKVRHVQVQTMETVVAPSIAKVEEEGVTVTSESEASPPQATTMEELEAQLAEERVQRQRLQAALEETWDHYEVLSGLAYKKLRELWEEKMRWENACMDLRDKLLEVGQPPAVVVDFPNSEFTVEEENEGQEA